MMKPKKNYVPGGMDVCQTPGYALFPLWIYLSRFNHIWECAAGEGYLATQLENFDYNVTATDISKDSRYDFFTFNPENGWECIVTNPPFGLKFKWIERCYELGKPWALLMPVEAIGAKAAQRQFKSHEPEIGIIYMDRRINFKMPNIGWKNKETGKRSAAQFPVAWYTWNMGFTGNRYYSFEWLTPERTMLFEYEK